MNKANIRRIKIENMKESALGLTLQIKLINKARLKDKTKNMNKTEKKLALVQKRLKVETQRNDEFNGWGFHSYIISYVVKCRILEDLIDCAQSCQLKPDVQV